MKGSSELIELVEADQPVNQSPFEKLPTLPIVSFTDSTFGLLFARILDKVKQEVLIDPQPEESQS